MHEMHKAGNTAKLTRPEFRDLDNEWSAAGFVLTV